MSRRLAMFDSLASENWVTSARLKLFLAAFLCLSTTIALGQTPTFTPYENHGAYSINLQNLNVIVNAPERQKSGALAFTAGHPLVFNIISGHLQPILVTTGGGLSVNRLVASGAKVGASITSNFLCDDGKTKTTLLTSLGVTTADGTFHSLGSTAQLDFTSWPNGSSCLGNPNSVTGTTTDGSGYTVSIHESSATVYGPDGSVSSATASSIGHYSPFTSVVDSNGNSVSGNGSYTTFTDSLGLTALTASGSTLSWTDVNAGTQQTTFSSSATNVKTAFGCGNTEENQSVSLLNNIAFADGTSLGITYEPTPGQSGYVTGRIAGITLPTGGSVAFAYSGANNGLDCTYLVPPTMTRTTVEGTWTYTWAYVMLGNGVYGNTTTVVDPAGNTTVYTFTGPNGTNYSAVLLTQVQVKQGSNTTLSTTNLCYNGSLNSATCSSTPYSYPVTQIDTFTTLTGMSTSSHTQKTIDAYGNTLTDATYDFGASSYTSKTTTTYGTWNQSTSACGPIGTFSYINNKPCDVVLSDGTHTISETRFTYDPHGNLLTKSVWTGSSWLNATATYNSNGTVATSTDFSGVLVTNTYGTGSCNGAFPTQTTSGGLTVSTTWNCDGGVPSVRTDANGNTTTFGYANSSGAADPFWRQSSVTDALGNVAYTIYSANSVEKKFSFGSSVSDSITFTDGLGRSILAQKRQGPSSSSYDTVSTSYGWNGLYATKSSSIPCTQTFDTPCSAGITTTNFDALGRVVSSVDGGTGTIAKSYSGLTFPDVLTTLGPAPAGENTKSTQKELDGLGRVKSVCSILSSGGSSCGQSTAASGILTSYSYSTSTGSSQVSATRGSQTRTTVRDALGRVTSSTTPEGGTTNYVYDSYPSGTCGGWTSEPGQLMLVGHANGSWSCYVHSDPLKRLTDSEGSSAGGNVCRRLRYDSVSNAVQSQPSGSTLNYLSGRLVEAETDNCTVFPPTSASMLTDEWFSYDKDGRITDIWQRTPHSGMYYHSVATYAGNGAVATLQLANITPNETSTYGFDGEGRPTTLVTFGQTIVSGTTLNAAGQPTVIDIGTSMDEDAYTYDPNTGRMTNWTFYVGSKNEAATLTWSPNGSLRQLAITDGFNAGGTQTCNFGTSSVMGYDDLGRLLSDNCGSTWAQTFTYDQYDNVTKSGSITWSPGYNPANNRYSLGGTSYDASGNLLTDTFHTYTWDAYGKVSTVDSSACGTTGECVTYDAFGHAVEISNGAAYTEIWYTQLGKTAYMNGNTLSYAYWPTPGGGTLLQIYHSTGSNLYFQHKDWLGNARVSSNLTTTVIDDRAFAPYGEMYQNFGSTSANELIFTGDTQDIVAGLYDTPNRELNPNQGRWLSPDPAGSGWNLYAYATNPNSGVDPTGLYVGGLTINGANVPYLNLFDGRPLTLGGGWSAVVSTAVTNGESDFCANGCSSSANAGADGSGTLDINVIFDSTANDGKGLTDAQKNAFQAVLDRAVKDFSGMGINTEVDYSDGFLTVVDGKAQVAGVDVGSWNVIVSDKTLSGSNETGYDPESGLLITDMSTHHLVVSGLYPFSQNSLEHEFGHVVMGDILLQPSPFRQVVGEVPVDTTVWLNRWGLSNSFKNAVFDGIPFQ